ISKLRETGSLKYVKISMVVQENNFTEMPDFVRLGKRFNFDAVFFSQLVNWGTYSDEEFNNRAIHLPAHPRHSEFVDLLRSEIFNEPTVHLGNLTHLKAINKNFITKWQALHERIRNHPRVERGRDNC
ncbi:MAG: hypothetical protein OEW09_10315, partial [Anaerolineae bacterium]|nr:hypothetical protein [Anaerolineae bacterium]